MLMQRDVDRLYELEKEDLEIIIEQAHNAIRLIKEKPCTCACHQQVVLGWVWLEHLMPCCDRTYQQF